jgi:hypothetical protein
MNQQILTSLARIRLYRERLQEDVASGNPVQGMADAAELATISKLLWEQFQKEAQTQESNFGQAS